MQRWVSQEQAAHSHEGFDRTYNTYDVASVAARFHHPPSPSWRYRFVFRHPSPLSPSLGVVYAFIIQCQAPLIHPLDSWTLRTSFISFLPSSRVDVATATNVKYFNTVTSCVIICFDTVHTVQFLQNCRILVRLQVSREKSIRPRKTKFWRFEECWIHVGSV